MLYITVKSKLGNSTCDWHIGERHPLKTIGWDGLDVVSIQADCDELTHIYRRFKNIPITEYNGSNPVQTWKAPWAQFIVDNL